MPESGQTKAIRAVREFFRDEASRYDDRHYGSRYRTCISDRHHAVVRAFKDLALPPGAEVLDIACGPGRFLHEVASQTTAIGIDASGEMLRDSRKRLGPGTALVRGSGLTLPFASGKFDVANSSGFIEYLPDPLTMLQETLRVLKPGGRAIISSTNRLSPAYLLAPIINVVRRSSMLRRMAGALRLPVQELSMRDRQFEIMLHTPGRLAGLLRLAGFTDVKLQHYHLQLLPHPFDHLLPAATTACVKLTDPLLAVRPFRVFSEGLLAIGTRPPA